MCVMQKVPDFTVQPQKSARGLKYLIQEVEGLYYLCSENKGADHAQLICVFVFAYIKSRFAHHAAHIFIPDYVKYSAGDLMLMIQSFQFSGQAS